MCAHRRPDRLPETKANRACLDIWGLKADSPRSSLASLGAGGVLRTELLDQNSKDLGKRLVISQRLWLLPSIEYSCAWSALGFLVEDGEITVIDENPVTPFSGDFPCNPLTGKQFHG